MEMGVKATPRPLYPRGRDPIPIEKQTVCPRAILNECGKYLSPGHLIP